NIANRASYFANPLAPAGPDAGAEPFAEAREVFAANANELKAIAASLHA
ncbi:MAG: hypothetical protein JSR18_15490, partial [Proteobacteria bacterium]|nr:hypothetical protein [Pseudomonadota bacterium]